MSLRDRTEVLWCPNARPGRGNGWKFPPAVEKRLLEDFADKRILHLFGGRSNFGTRLDIDLLVTPDVIGDAWLPPFGKDTFDVVVLDPPYVHLNSRMKNSLLQASGYIARETVVWFSTFWISSSMGLEAERAWLVRVGDNCYTRCLQYFSVKKKYERPRWFTRGPAIKYNRWIAQPRGFVW